MCVQLEFFPKTETEILKDEIKRIKETSENVRRGLFARHNELSKLVLQQQQKIETLENILKGYKQIEL